MEGAVIFLLFASVVIAVTAFRRSLGRRSGTTLAAFAKAHELDVYGDELPMDFPEELLERLPSRNIRDCLSGVRNGERVVCFDFSDGFLGSILSGRRRKRWATAVALKRAHTDVVLMTGYGDTVECGAWVMIGGSGEWGLRSAERVLEAWDSLKTTSDDEGTDLERAQRSAANLVIRPKHGTFAERQGRG